MYRTSAGRIQSPARDSQVRGVRSCLRDGSGMRKQQSAQTKKRLAADNLRDCFHIYAPMRPFCPLRQSHRRGSATPDASCSDLVEAVDRQAPEIKLGALEQASLGIRIVLRVGRGFLVVLGFDDRELPIMSSFGPTKGRRIFTLRFVLCIRRAGPCGRANRGGRRSSGRKR